MAPNENMESGTEVRPECMDLLEREYDDNGVAKNNIAGVKVVKAGQYNAGKKERTPMGGSRRAISKQVCTPRLSKIM